MVSAVYVIVGLVALQRLAEMAHARRNTRRLLGAGGQEAGRGHYPLFVLLHGAWLGAIVAAAEPGGSLNLALLGLYLALQLARLWVIVSLGRYWTTRIIVPPDGALVRHGPYRFMRHPNYLVVALEIAVLPLVFGAWEVALAFSILNLALLAYRIRIEDAALAAKRKPAADGRPINPRASSGC